MRKGGKSLGTERKRGVFELNGMGFAVTGGGEKNNSNWGVSRVALSTRARTEGKTEKAAQGLRAASVGKQQTEKHGKEAFGGDNRDGKWWGPNIGFTGTETGGNVDAGST